LDCAGGGAHIFGSNNTLTLTGGCKWLDMVGSNNTFIVALASGANIDFAGSNNAITWTSPDGKEPVVRHLVRGTLSLIAIFPFFCAVFAGRLSVQGREGPGAMSQR
jgi:DUF3060 family protein